MRKIAALIALVLMVFPACASSPENPTATADAGSTPTAPSGEKGGSSKGEGAPWTGPDFSVETFDGETFTLADHAGTPIVLNFWESW